MTTIKLFLFGKIDLEELNDICSGVSATVEIGTDAGELTLLLTSTDSADCAELLVGWLEIAGVAAELEQLQTTSSTDSVGHKKSGTFASGASHREGEL